MTRFLIIPLLESATVNDMSESQPVKKSHTDSNKVQFGVYSRAKQELLLCANQNLAWKIPLG